MSIVMQLPAALFHPLSQQGMPLHPDEAQKRGGG